ncbi:MAG: tRNA pseudouridine(55) synthase TruB [Clostridia bacterium]|nr:tRNA pseudouridine(55) synthase TruB [Clostridia bacterium]
MALSEPSGLLILNKPIGITSHDCVYKIRRLYSTKRVGHTGTLDPLATGVLVMLVGRAAKAAEYLSADTKGYVATLRLGITTDTEDITGKILTESHDIPSADKVRAVANGFLGDIKQIPPMYSAIKVGGKKLYDLAREGITVEREARDVTVHSLTVTPTDDIAKYTLSVECSSGTYIRTLCADIGNALGSGGVMETLLRTRVGNFKLSEAHTPEELEAMSEDERISLLLPIEKLFDSLPSVYLPAFYERLCRNGCEIYEKKIKTNLSVGERVKLYSEKGVFFALGEVREYPDGNAIKAIKIFEL